MMGIRVKVEIVVFVTRIWFWAYVQPEDSRCNFCENKKLRKKLGIYCRLWLYKHIRVYSLYAALCNSFQIHSETFSSACGFFPQGLPRKSGVFLYFPISLLCH